jgi:hypothetical protein
VNPALITVIALGVVLVVGWDGFCLRDLIRADPATVRYLDKGAWAIICLLSCPFGGLLYVIAGRGGFGRVLEGRGQPPAASEQHDAGRRGQSAT